MLCMEYAIRITRKLMPIPMRCPNMISSVVGDSVGVLVGGIVVGHTVDGGNEMVGMVDNVGMAVGTGDGNGVG